MLETNFDKARENGPQRASFKNEYGSRTSVTVYYRRPTSFEVEVWVRKLIQDDGTERIKIHTREIPATEHQAFIEDLQKRTEGHNEAV